MWFMTFSEQVKSVRATLLLSQGQLAEKLGVSYVTVSRWESKKDRAVIFDKSKV